MRSADPRTPIADYAVVGDLHTAALVSRYGSIDWLCLPRFDSRACLAAFLDGDHAGAWRIAPAAGGPATRRRYRGETLIVESEWDTPDGTVRLVDCMPPRDGAARAVRVVEGVSGRVTMRMLLRLRLADGHRTPWLRHANTDLVAVRGPDSFELRTDVRLSELAGTTRAEFSVAAGERVSFVLTHHPSHVERPAPVDAVRAIAATESFWSAWVARTTYRGAWTAAVHRALVTVKALTYAPTGGVAASVTTALPHHLGTDDHRTCRLRDATATLRALFDTGYVAEARAWREWLVRALAGEPVAPRSRYTLDGVPCDREGIDWPTAGGEVVTALHHADHVTSPDPHRADDVRRSLLDHLEGSWEQPDNSLWELRGPRQHHVHSKVMAWAGLDQAVRAVERHGMAGPVDRWRALRARIRAEVCGNGYDPERNTFTQYYGSHGVDAALLLLPKVGFLPWRDTRIRGTVQAVHAELSQDGLLLRHRTNAGAEPPWLAGSFWLADALHGIGRTSEATALFERLLTLRNDVGLLAEDHDPTSGGQVGGGPSAASAVALVNTALRLGGPVDAAHPTDGHPTSVR